MPLTLQQIRDYVRTSLDIEQDDLPDTLLDTYVREGSKRIERAEARWPFYEAAYDVGIDVGDDFTAKASIAPDLDQIAAIAHTAGSHPPLTWIGMDLMNELRSQRARVGRPIHFSEWGGDVYWFPTPDVQYTMTVRGYRTAADWVSQGAGASPDMPDELHNTIAVWTLSKAYAQQEDPELAALYERQFSDELNEMRRRLVVTPHQQPLVLNGGSGRQLILARPRYDWETT